jgi:hypothetical protein
VSELRNIDEGIQAYFSDSSKKDFDLIPKSMVDSIGIQTSSFEKLSTPKREDPLKETSKFPDAVVREEMKIHDLSLTKEGKLESESSFRDYYTDSKIKRGDITSLKKLRTGINIDTDSSGGGNISPLITQIKVKPKITKKKVNLIKLKAE